MDDLTEDGKEIMEAEGLRGVVVEVEIKDTASGGESVGVSLFCVSAFCGSAFCTRARGSVTMSWPSAVTFILTFDALMMSERRVPASLLILKAQP